MAMHWLAIVVALVVLNISMSSPLVIEALFVLTLIQASLEAGHLSFGFLYSLLVFI